MKTIKLGNVLAGSIVLFLIGCSSAPKNSDVQLKPKTVELSVLMEQAAATEKSATKDAALRQYEEAAKTYPASKLPWARVAQIQFDSANYGEAIVAAQQVVARDEKDKVAHSILSVSGLRVSTKALADLSRQNELSGSIRSEAQSLTKVLRESLGEQVLIPSGAPRPPPVPQVQPKPPVKAASQPSPASSGGSASGGNGNPFGALK
jgi:hypothetical protein